MRILVFTSKDHIYANIILNGLITSGVLDNHDVTVLEQNSIIPNKSTLHGLNKYLIIAGWYYVLAQATKQYLFIIVRTIAYIRNNRGSQFYPYYHHHRIKVLRSTLNNIASAQNAKIIRGLKPDIILSLYSKEIIPLTIISLPKYGAVNLHPALLPSYRGVSPTFWCLVNKEKMSGVSLHHLDQGIDTGNIISQTVIPTQNIKTEHQLYIKCTYSGLELILKYLNNPKVKDKFIPHSHVKPSYNSIPSKTAVKKFISNGYRFFTLQEFIQ